MLKMMTHNPTSSAKVVQILRPSKSSAWATEDLKTGSVSPVEVCSCDHRPPTLFTKAAAKEDTNKAALMFLQASMRYAAMETSVIQMH